MSDICARASGISQLGIKERIAQIRQLILERDTLAAKLASFYCVRCGRSEPCGIAGGCNMILRGNR
jgi:hypothetical protein